MEINNSNTTTLNEKSDEDLIQEFKTTENEDAFNILLKRHVALYYTVSQRFIPILERRGISSYDVASDRYYVFYESIRSFKPEKKVKFSTWLGKYTHYHCLNIIDKNFNNSLFDYDICQLPDRAAEEHDWHIYEYIMDILGKLKDQRMKKIFVSRFLSGPTNKPWKLVAKDLGLSNQRCIDMFIQTKKFLRRKIDRPELLDDF